jgi:hypothetical protein
LLNINQNKNKKMKIQLRSGCYFLLPIASLIIILLLFPTGCKNYNEIDLYPPCDSINVSYADEIQPIISANCLPCHSIANKFGGIILAVLDSARIPARNGLLLKSVTHDPGVIPMPKGGAKLPACDIAKIRRWISLDEPAK